MKQVFNKNNRILIGFVILIALLVLRCYYSFDNLDESYYLACVDRFWKGDGPIIDEWHPTQLFFLMQLPVYSLYRLIVPNGEGVYLFFRIFSVTLSAVTAFIVYKTLNKQYRSISAFLCAVLILSFSRSNIQGISYYGVFVDSICLMLLCEELRLRRNKDSLLFGVLVGLLYSISVACMPYQIVLLVPVLVYYCHKRLHRTGIGFLTGMSAVACYYLSLFQMLHVNLLQAWRLLPFLLMDEEHTYGYVRRMASAFKLTLEAMTIPGCVIFGLMLLLVFLKRNSEKTVWVFGFIGSAISIANNIKYADRAYVIFVFYMIPILIMMWKQGIIKHKSFPLYLILLGVIEAIVFTSGSNMNIDALSTGMVIAAVGCVLALDRYYREENLLRKVGFIFSLLITIVAYGQRILITANDTSLSNMTCKVDHGVLKGITVSQEFEERYNDYLDDISLIDMKNQRTRVYIADAPSWLYVASNWKCSNSSTWGRVVLSPKMDKYYKLHPDKYPDVIFMGKSETSTKEIDTRWVPSYILEDFNSGYRYIEGKALDIYVKD